jgi:3-deoxy-manno-octulosonate cytidylyltransferase (CMP-KDO synthetase)
MHVIIPARYASTRLPGKPLLEIAGKPMLQHVYERARTAGARSVTVATDDERIRAACERFGAPVCLTSGKHRSGTERIAEAIAKLGLGAEEIVVNLQGDEPLMPPELIRLVHDTLVAHPSAAAATVCHRITDPTEFANPNVVKVVLDGNGYAMYFSRAPIPWPREQTGGVPVEGFRHIGIYAYRAGFVGRYVSWAPCPVEEIEQLEQLRVLWYGERIAVAVCEQILVPEVSVDTAADMERVRKIFEKLDNPR